MRADGTELEAITPIEELAREPALSPDGAQLAYTTPEGIKLRDMATGQTELLPDSDSQPAWSPDGARLVYISRSANTRTLLSLPDRTIQEQVGCVSCSDSEMTPDGAHVVYSEINTTGVDGQFTVIAANWQTGKVRGLVLLTPTPIISPTLSPDGVWVAAAYECPRDDRSSLWASPFAVTTPACEGRRITRAGSASATNPKWGPGLLIAYERGEPPRDIAIVSADTGEECVIERPGDDRNPSWGAPTVFDNPQ
jgi:Tol biopolymer transport system component